MKTISLLALLLLAAFFVEAGNPVSTVGEKRSILYLNKRREFFITMAPADTGQFNSQRLFQVERKIHNGESLTIAGIGMFAGGVLVTMAAVGFSREVYNINNSYYNYYNYYGYGYNPPERSVTGPTTGAVMCYIIGPGCLLASIPLIAIGAVRWSAGSFEKRMYFQLQGTAGQNGMGMKMTF